jgi:hypothetical protein
MEIGRKSARALIALTLLSIFWSVWQQPSSVALGQGAKRKIPAYHDGELVTINILELNPSDALIAKNKSINEIYVSNDLDEEQDFNPVIDAIQGDEFNPLWRQILITFNAGFTPHQFFSEEEINAAAAGPNPEITLVETDEVYLCAVVGRK